MMLLFGLLFMWLVCPMIFWALIALGVFGALVESHERKERSRS